ncbi:actin-related protein 2/3 complex subunit 2B isoform X2 [Rosa chinensis]|uniref:actin-related protein 2/3 complex subunit 2B isoform X2 n=1 Tax=Rosa chinensis TaxID=74649 RepID=UPI000D0888C6|nr:actin-related protein 2/3 complex subunit 2B isoform X2 [Rosa chinensis]
MRKKGISLSMACLERASPALKEILLKLYHANKSTEIDHHLYEFGSVEYHIQSSASDEHITYLSISTPLLTQEVLLPYGFSHRTKQMVTAICPDAVEIIEPAKEGYQLTLRLDFAKLPNGKDSLKVIAEISAVQARILSSRLKEILMNVNSQDSYQGMYKPIKLVYRPSEPFFIIIQPQKIIAVFPIHFTDKPDVIIATTFFQELMDVGSSEKWAKAPPCCWSPIPPPGLRGELFEDLSTTGGFVSFEISPRHVKGKKLDKTVWSLLNFYAYVKFHVKSTRSFIQRRMRKRLEGLVELLHKRNIKVEDEEEEKRRHKIQENAGFKCTIRIANLPKLSVLKRRYNGFSRTIKRIRSRIRIHGFGRFRHRWLKIPKFSSSMGYTKLE